MNGNLIIRGLLLVTSFFMPPVLSVALWDKCLNISQPKDKSSIIEEYVLFFLIIHLVDVYVLAMRTGEIQRVMKDLVLDVNFSSGYLLQSLLVSVVVPCVGRVIEAIRRGRGRSAGCYGAHSERFISLLTAFLFLVNFADIFDNNFWGDETYTIALAQMPVKEMLKATARDVHPPFFYLVEIALNSLFGSHGWVYRLASIIPYGMELLFIVSAIRREFGNIPAVIMIVFSSILKSTIKYNVEARMYSWASFFVLLSYFYFYQIMKDPGKRKNWILFTLFTLGAAYTHYYAFLMVAFFYLAILIDTFRNRIPAKRTVLAYLVALAGYSPWLLQMLETFRRTSGSFWMTSASAFYSGLTYYFNANSELFTFSMTFAAIVIIALALLYDHRKKSKAVIRQGQVMSVETKWLIWGIITAVGVIAIGELVSVLIRPTYVERYSYPASTIVWLVLGICITKLKSCKKFFTVIVVSTLMVCVPYAVKDYIRKQKEDKLCQATSDYAREAITNNDLILTNVNYLYWTGLDYYVPNVRHMYVSEMPSSDMLTFSGDNWLIWSSELSEDDLEVLEREGYKAEETYHSGNLGTIFVNIYHLIKEN